MTYREAVRQFRESYRELYENQVDYWTAQECWAAYVDSLCKDGIITQRQYDRWGTPFKYGKRLSIRTVFSH